MRLIDTVPWLRRAGAVVSVVGTPAGCATSTNGRPAAPPDQIALR